MLHILQYIIRIPDNMGSILFFTENPTAPTLVQRLMNTCIIAAFGLLFEKRLHPYIHVCIPYPVSMGLITPFFPHKHSIL